MSNDFESQDDQTQENQQIDLRRAFFDALDKTGYQAKQIQQATGVTNAAISFFRHGRRDIYLKTFQRMLEVLPLDTYLYFYAQLGQGLSETASDSVISKEFQSPELLIAALLQFCDDKQLEAVTIALADVVRDREEKGNCSVSIMTLILKLMNFLHLKEIPELINQVGKYTAYAISRSVNGKKE